MSYNNGNILPQGWVWTTLGEICIISSGGTPDRKKTNYYLGEMPWVKSGELNYNIITETDEHINNEAINESSAKVLPKETLLVALYGATVGRLAILGIEAATNQAIGALICTESVYNKFLFYYLIQNKEILLQQRQGGAQQNISLKILQNFACPLPSFKEQRAIVSKIEELFSELDKATDELKRVHKQLNIYKRSILNNAYKKAKDIDNNKNSESEEHWVKLADICKISGGIAKGKDFKDKETIKLPYLRVANVQDGYLDLNEIKDIELLSSEKDKYTLEYGDILYTEGGDKDKLGRGTIWRNEIKNCVHQNHIFKARLLNDNIDPKYISYYSQTQGAKKYFFDNAKQTTNLASINLNTLKNLPIPICSLQIQRQIIEEIESITSICENVENYIVSGIDKSDEFRFVILRKAYNGKLIKTELENEAILNILDIVKIEKEKLLIDVLSLKKTNQNKKKAQKTEMEPKDIISIIKEHNNLISAYDLWQLSIHRDNIDNFYSEIKSLSDNNIIIEKQREGKVSFIKLAIGNEN